MATCHGGSLVELAAAVFREEPSALLVHSGPYRTLEPAGSEAGGEVGTSVSVAVGRTLSHFRLTEVIGSGGMGVVYRARDLHLERDVAIKVLPTGMLADSGARERFRGEALALSKLNHPAIATVFDFDTQDGVDFLVMEYVPGTSLDDKLAEGALGEREIVALSTQLMEGLGAAHERGIVHRDLKPANLRVTPDGRLKILDFGLAKLLRPRTEQGATETVTRTRGIVGTLPYMAPEQVRGGRIDARTDLYAAGVVLYEMATNHRPFREKDPARLLYAIAHEAPASPRSHRGEISADLETVILKALEKDPAVRYQTAQQLGEDLRRLAAGLELTAPRPARRRALVWALAPVLALVLLVVALFSLDLGDLRRRLLGDGPPRIASLAVLPLANLSGDPDQEYFADGMTEALITDLGKIGALRVIARPSVMRFKNSDRPLSEIARQLDVEALVVGSATPVGDRTRITAQLIDAGTERVLWAESYERGLTDVLRLQGELARAIAGRIQVSVTPQEGARLAVTRTVDPEAHRIYLRGRHHVSKFTKNDFVRAVELFERAIEIDPTYAEAHASLGFSCFALGQPFGLSDEKWMPRAMRAVQQALDLDDTVVEAWLTLGYLEHIWRWNWSEAGIAYQRALETNPNHAYAHSAYAFFLLAMARRDEAVAEARLGVLLDPLSLTAGAHLGEILVFARHYDEALEECRRLIELDENFQRTYAVLRWIYERTARYEEALAALEKHYALAGAAPEEYSFARRGWEHAGAEGYWRALKEDFERNGAFYNAARAATYLGEPEAVFALLEKAYESRAGGLALGLAVDTEFDDLRDDPRFGDLLGRLGLPAEEP